jgi:hypothetical protein
MRLPTALPRAPRTNRNAAATALIVCLEKLVTMFPPNGLPLHLLAFSVFQKCGDASYIEHFRRINVLSLKCLTLHAPQRLLGVLDMRQP